jgi:membrane-associated protein
MLTSHAIATSVVAASPIDPNHLLSTFGLAGLLLVIFAECGLLIGFFLPGDTLLFAAGLLIATGKLHDSIWVFVILVPLAAIAGNLVGYWIGYRAGPKVFQRPNSRLFRPEYVDRSEAFFERFGSWTIVLARFVPVVRTVATVMAGVSRMRFSVYAVYSIIGGIIWSVGVLLAGYGLGHFEFVQKHVEPLIDPILIGVVVLSLLPVTIHYLRGRRADKRAGGNAAHSGGHRAAEPVAAADPVVSDEPGTPTAVSDS